MGIVWIVLSLINYNRTLVFLDVFVVIFAAYFIVGLFAHRLHIWKYLAFALLLGWSGYYMMYVQGRSRALIPQEEFFSIQNIAKITEPNALIMNTHREYSPWIMGRSERDYINPGMADMDLWTHQQWNQWRSVDGVQKCTMHQMTYAPLARPLYIWLGSMQFIENLSG